MANKRQQVEVRLQTLVAENKWDLLLSTCEQYEFESSNEPASATTLPFYGVQLFGYLLVNDLNSARFLWKRIPTEIRAAVPEFASIWKIGQSMWKRDYANIYSSLQINWSPAYQALATKLTEQFRQQTFILLSRAYTTISVSHCAVILGLNPAETIKAVVARGWQHDAALGMLKAVAVVETAVAPNALDQLQDLTRYVVYLETR